MTDTLPARKALTLHRLRQMHAEGERIAMLTCYDASFAAGRPGALGHGAYSSFSAGRTVHADEDAGGQIGLFVMAASDAHRTRRVMNGAVRDAAEKNTADGAVSV